MLPFLKPTRKDAGLIVETRKADESKSQEPEDSDDQGLLACAEDLIRAINAKDAQSVASAIKAAFEVCSSYPEESEEMPEESMGD